MLPTLSSHRITQFFWNALTDPNLAWWEIQHKYGRRQSIVIVASSHRVGSTWLHRIIRDLGNFKNGLRELPSNLNYRNAGLLPWGDEAVTHLKRLQGKYIFKSHSLPPNVADIPRTTKFVSVYRDPRDVLVSASYYLAKLPIEKGGLGQPFAELAIPQRIEWLITHSIFLQELEEWYRASFAHQVRYEDMLERPVEELQAIAQFLQIKASMQYLDEIVSRHSFAKPISPQPGGVSNNLAARKGIAGDWRNHFNQVCLEVFQSHENGRWNNLLIEMGYERDPSWLNAPSEIFQ